MFLKKMKLGRGELLRLDMDRVPWPEPWPPSPNKGADAGAKVAPKDGIARLQRRRTWSQRIPAVISARRRSAASVCAGVIVLTSSDRLADACRPESEASFCAMVSQA